MNEENYLLIKQLISERVLKSIPNWLFLSPPILLLLNNKLATFQSIFVLLYSVGNFKISRKSTKRATKTERKAKQLTDF